MSPDFQPKIRPAVLRRRSKIPPQRHLRRVRYGSEGRHVPGKRERELTRVMHVSTSLNEWRQRRRAMTEGKIGFVPTMGALHEGHASLVRRSREQNGTTVVSIFRQSNTEFNNARMISRTTRARSKTISICCAISGADEVFVPSAQELYPEVVTAASASKANAACPELTNTIEGKSRPGHFRRRHDHRDEALQPGPCRSRLVWRNRFPAIACHHCNDERIPHPHRYHLLPHHTRKIRSRHELTQHTALTGRPRTRLP